MGTLNLDLPFFNVCRVAQAELLNEDTAIGINLTPHAHPSRSKFVPIGTEQVRKEDLLSITLDQAGVEKNQGQRPTLKKGVTACLVLAAGLTAQRCINTYCSQCGERRECQPERRVLPIGCEAVQIKSNPLEI